MIIVRFDLSLKKRYQKGFLFQYKDPENKIPQKVRLVIKSTVYRPKSSTRVAKTLAKRAIFKIFKWIGFCFRNQAIGGGLQQK